MKTVWFITERSGEAASLSAIAQDMGQKASTASEAMKRLVDRGLVHHERYLGVTLTPEGQRLALAMVRRHRLVEMFLCETLGYTWDEVHDEAEVLEHAITDTLLDRIDEHLGHPTRDPHGDPIPAADGTMDDVGTEDLSTVAVGETAIIDRILDRDADLLRYLAAHGVTPGAQITVTDAPYPGMRVVQAEGFDPAPIADAALEAINIRATTPQG
ncbi:metal-dependent transcriptional regulator [Corynebacterium sp. 13CS0277]|nr:metal-dependent transcriptional regulator [Corynebacterium sp. 13CS0277]